MADIVRLRPPEVAQSLTDSCWAATLESWSTIESQIPQQQQQTLINALGEGPTGGITPHVKIPLISRQFGMIWQVFEGSGLKQYINQHLPTSHLMCVFTVGAFSHAVLVYKFTEPDRVVVMDPREGRYRWFSIGWLQNRRQVMMMRRRPPVFAWPTVSQTRRSGR